MPDTAAAMKFAVSLAQLRAQQPPTPDQVCAFLESAEEVQRFFAARSLSLKGVISDQVFTSSLLDMLNQEVATGVLVLSDGSLFTVHFEGDRPPTNDELIKLIQVPGFEEAKKHAEKLQERRKGEVDAGEKAPTETPA
jgi:hypothetical protein